MSQSTVVEWLNENEQRAYPLVTASPNIITVGPLQYNIHKVFLDANIIYIAEDMPDKVKVERIDTDGINAQIYLTGDTTPYFQIDEVADQPFPLAIRNSQGSLLVLGEEFIKIVTSGISHMLEDIIFEPSVVSEFRGSLRGINSIAFNNHTLVGEITLTEGYQTDIQFQDGNTLFLEIGNNAGLPLGCQDFFQDELDYDCDELISWINSASPTENGGTVRLVAGRNVRIYEDKSNSRIYIGLDFTPNEICQQPQLPPQV